MSSDLSFWTVEIPLQKKRLWHFGLIPLRAVLGYVSDRGWKSHPACLFSPWAFCVDFLVKCIKIQSTHFKRHAENNPPPPFLIPHCLPSRVMSRLWTAEHRPFSLMLLNVCSYFKLSQPRCYWKAPEIYLIVQSGGSSLNTAGLTFNILIRHPVLMMRS